MAAPLVPYLGVGTKKEKQKLQSTAVVLIVLGYVVVLAANLFTMTMGDRPPPEDFNALLQQFQAPEMMSVIIGLVAGSLLHIWGMGLYAKSKGYSAIIGVLISVGMCCCLGLIVMIMLPDKYEVKSPRRKKRKTRKRSR